MLISHLKVAWRNLKKEKLFTLVKVGGFSFGIAACLLIALFVIDELRYDSHYKNRDRIFRLVLEADINGEIMKSTHFPLPLAETLEADFPDIEKAGKISGAAASGQKRAIRRAEDAQNNYEPGFLYADQATFDILEISLKQGNSREALSRPRSIVISASKAAKYFPDGQALGQSIVLDNNSSQPYTVTGIMDDFPSKSHLHFDFMLPIEDHERNWTTQSYFTYVLVKEHSNPKELENKMVSVVENYIIPAQLARGRDAGFIEVLRKIEYKLQPIEDIHLRSDPKMADGLTHGDIRLVWLLCAIAVFILLLAGINFVNLSTAKSARKAKEVGLRKTVGANKGNLITQFLMESILLSGISFTLGVLLTWLTIPAFNRIAEKSISLPWASWGFVPVLFASSLFVGFLAGLYPAFYLSAFRPASVLSGSVEFGGKKSRLRMALVVFQFTISSILILGTLVVYRQMDYILQKDLGYDKEQVLILEGVPNSKSFKEQLTALSSVKEVSQTGYIPVEGFKRNQTTFKEVGGSSEKAGVLSQTWEVDYDYIKTLGLRLQEGRDFSKSLASDSVNAVIINQQMAFDLALGEPLGKELDNNYQHWKIIGVIQDFHFSSLKGDIGPVALVIGKDRSTLSVRLNSDNFSETLESVEALWERHIPDRDFNYSFLDQRFAKMHEDVKRFGQLFNAAAFLAILVACLGLFALSAYMVEQRKKEISIRIVLGAPFLSIYNLLTAEFLKLVILALAIAFPMGWYLMSRWLEDFAYRVDIGSGMFILTAACIIAIAISTVSIQSLKAAMANPVKSLQKE